MESIDCIYLAAGIGKRMKNKTPKQLIRIGGKPIMIYSLETLMKINNFKNFIITYPPGFKSTYEEILSEYFIEDMFKKIKLVMGGTTRQDSVYNALKHVSTKRTLIHEAARPFVSTDLVNRVLKYSDDAVVPVIEIPFTVAAGDEYMVKTFKREELKNIQLPQIFNTEILRNAHQRAKKEGLFFTDDSTLVFHYGYKVRFIAGEDINIKITTPLDLIVMERILFSRNLPSE